MSGKSSRQKDQGLSVNLVKSKQSKKVTCYSCGKEGHMIRDKNCLAKGKKCAKCGKYGHFVACCKAQKASRNYTGGRRHVKGGQDGRRRLRRRGTANCLGEEDASDSEDDEFAFAATEEVQNMCATTEEPAVSVSINGIGKDEFIDSGSVSELKELKAQCLQTGLECCNKSCLLVVARNSK